MSGTPKVESRRRVNSWRIAAWAAAALMLLLPLIAMQFTDEVAWDVTDFAVFGALLVGVGGFLELAVRKTANSSYRTGAGLALLAAFLLVWMNGAVGIIGSEDDDANLMFFGVVAVGLIGAVMARFEPRGMARAMVATAGAQVLAFAVALVAGWGSAGPVTVVFCVLWLGAAWLFRRAATEPSPGRVTADV